MERSSAGDELVMLPRRPWDSNGTINIVVARRKWRRCIVRSFCLRLSEQWVKVFVIIAFSCLCSITLLDLSSRYRLFFREFGWIIRLVWNKSRLGDGVNHLSAFLFHDRSSLGSPFGSLNPQKMYPLRFRSRFSSTSHKFSEHRSIRSDCGSRERRDFNFRISFTHFRNERDNRELFTRCVLIAVSTDSRKCYSFALFSSAVTTSCMLKHGLFTIAYLGVTSFRNAHFSYCKLLIRLRFCEFCVVFPVVLKLRFPTPYLSRSEKY